MQRSDNLGDNPCEVCGKPATNWAEDAVIQPPSGSPFIECKRGPVHFGCDEHPARGERVQYEGPMTLLGED